jgi:tetratricopeptide (TPR) repeat protein
MHARIAAGEERAWGDRVAEVAGELAYHYGACGNRLKALKFLELAAKQAEFRLAHRDAMQHYRAALQLLEILPEGSDRDRREIELWQSYLPVILRTREMSTVEAGAGFERALKLCEKLGETTQHFRLLRRQCEFHFGRGEHQIAHELAARMLLIAETSGRSDWLQSAYTQVGSTLYYLGDLTAAHDNFVAALNCDADRQKQPTALGARIDCLSLDAEVLWMLGYGDQAQARIDDALQLARESAAPSSFALALTHAHMHSFFSGEYNTALEYAREGIEIAVARKLEYLEAALRWSLENVKVFAGLSTDIEQPRKAFATYHELGTRLHLPANYMFLARCCAILGQPALGMAMIDQSIAAIAETGQRTWEAETWRVKGELTIQLATHVNLTGDSLMTHQRQAESYVQDALAIARKQKARVFELRAAATLVRFAHDASEEANARRTLATIYESFTEGRNNPDFRAAESLIGNKCLSADRRSAGKAA